MDILYKILSDGFQILAGGDKREYLVKYPQEVFSKLDKKSQIALAENFVYVRYRNLSFIKKEELHFNFSPPFWKNFTDWGIHNDLPRISDANKIPTAQMKKEFEKSEKKIMFLDSVPQTLKASSFFGFQPSRNNPPPLSSPLKRGMREKEAGSAVLAVSFGKDSLLSWGLAKEIGLNVHPVFVREMENEFSVENQIKKRIIKEFRYEQKERVDFLYDNADEIFYHQKKEKNIKELDNSNAMLAFCLEFLPYANYYRSPYIILGNEQNLNNYFVNRYKVKTYPSFDQTSFYTKKLNILMNKFASAPLNVVSLVEPLYNIAEMKILYNRYPRLLKYVMSCEPEKGNSKWCYSCSMCAESYMYAAAFGVNPRKIGFAKDFFQAKYQNLYPLFNQNIEWFYDKPKEIKEGGLLAFLLAFQNGAQGDLIELFKKKYLKEAKKQESYLRKKYFGIHPMTNVPLELKPKLLEIFKQELAY